MRKTIDSFEDTIEEMARIGYINKNNNPDEVSDFELVVYTDDEGNIPHMHVKIQGKVNACIRYDSAEYFEHGKYTNKVPMKVAKQIDRLLRSKNEFTCDTQWKAAVLMWNMNNSKMKLDKNIVQPDYTKLNK